MFNVFNEKAEPFFEGSALVTATGFKPVTFTSVV